MERLQQPASWAVPASLRKWVYRQLSQRFVGFELIFLLFRTRFQDHYVIPRVSLQLDQRVKPVVLVERLASKDYMNSTSLILRRRSLLPFPYI